LEIGKEVKALGDTHVAKIGTGGDANGTERHDGSKYAKRNTSAVQKGPWQRRNGAEPTKIFGNVRAFHLRCVCLFAFLFRAAESPALQCVASSLAAAVGRRAGIAPVRSVLWCLPTVSPRLLSDFGRVVDRGPRRWLGLPIGPAHSRWRVFPGRGPSRRRLRMSVPTRLPWPR
jgi:hypothetical protein